MSRPRQLAWLGCVVVFALVADQASKAWARGLPVGPAGCSTEHAGEPPTSRVRCRGVPQPVIDGWWDWELARNDGAAFSSLRGQRVLLVAIALIAVVGFGVAAVRTAPRQRLRWIGLGLVIGGALGNVVDRVRNGVVTDFIRWRFGELRWPVFNIADVALVVGVGLIVLESFAERRRTTRLPA